MALVAHCCCCVAARRVPPTTLRSSSSVRRYATGLLETVARLRPDKEQAQPLYLRCFPLRAGDVVESPYCPEAFHRTLCRKIRESSKRVQLASLYVGAAAAAASASPSSEDSAHRRAVSAANNDHRERELLEAIRQASSAGVPVQILLDANRALRPVPIPSSSSPSTTVTSTTTSAQACCEAVGNEGRDSHASGVFLLSVLDPVLQRVLPNPLNEIAGVFHVKVYVIDGDVILSGANLSREYFTTRIDRYLHLRQHDLVEFYSTLVRTLCQHGAVRYGPCQVDQRRFRSGHWAAFIARRRQLLAALEELFTTMEPPSTVYDPSSVVAYAIPTFQAPAQYFRSSKPLQFLNHEQTLLNLLKSIHLAAPRTHAHSSRLTVTARIATAYMNPTRPFLDALAQCCDRTVFLTAGMASHGFAPKKDQPESSQRHEDQSQGWAIPNVFRHASRRAVAHIAHRQRSRQQQQQQQQRPNSPEPVREQVSMQFAAQVAYYQRPGWTFHAKGMWLSVKDASATPRNKQQEAAVEFASDERLVAVCTGSGNYGARSALRDMESNLIVVFPPSPGATSQSICGAAPSIHSQHANPLVRQHVKEWDRFCEFVGGTNEEEPEPPRWIRILFPWVRRFF